MLLVMAILASIAACALVIVVLFLAVSANNTLRAIQRQQAEEFTGLKRAITELRKPSLSTPDDGHVGELPRIGASERVLQVGDYVEVIDGLHSGEHGTIVPSPEWLPNGVVCVELTGVQGPRYVEVSKMARLDEAGRE